ncbi:MAG: Asp-tRNA(Asn)/Glu-tRNA(Gln) amidotransferase subunit GatB [Candidatus Brocadiia bacterium]|nr:Asp-tRNA(Asn)/Glu-tRNA(Gln) amidotransferase subunit GatB [Candidatus Brocadiia bacterium]
MEWEVVIGLEVHAQLLTQSKMFCSCAADYQAASPNSRVCPVCLAMPGTLPVINERAVEFVIMTGLALNCAIADYAQFDRKNYAYPDLMKGYQISQFDHPIAHGGWMTLETDGVERRAGITRAHLEEDVAKLQHVRDGTGGGYSLVDVNRSGVPLMEVVGEPDLRTPDEARQYLMKLRTILQYLGVSTCDMEQGSFRCDANVSLRPVGAEALGAKVEVKNMNSFRAVHRALQFEIERQTRVLDQGDRIGQETRGWVEERGVTVSQRSKEFAHDYRYFPEPDLPPLLISRAWVDKVREALPELPDARRERFAAEYGLSVYDASLLTATKPTADYFEKTVGQRPLEGEPRARAAKSVANWLNGEMNRLLNESGTSIADAPIAPSALVELIGLVDARTISSTQARDVFEEMFKTGVEPGKIVEARGMTQLTDADAVLPAVEEAISANEAAVQDYLGGKETAIRFLVGQVMKISRGKADPALVNRLLAERLEARRA